MLLLFSLHKKRCTIIPHHICWCCRVYADDNQVVIHESNNNVVVVVVNCEVSTTTTSWEPDIDVAATALVNIDHCSKYYKIGIRKYEFGTESKWKCCNSTDGRKQGPPVKSCHLCILMTTTTERA
jgi:hypothetical protein